MYQRDYILRLIERFGRALIALRNRILRREVDLADVRMHVHEIAQEAGLDLDIARRLDADSLLIWLSPAGEIDPPRVWLMAELLYLEALQARSSATGDVRQLDLERAHTLFSRLPADWKPSGQFPSAAERAAEVQALLTAD